MAKQGKEIKTNLIKSTIGDEAYSKIGTYMERAGGGDELEKGESFVLVDNVEEAEKHREEHPDDKVRVLQPRDENGRFAHNSVNKRDRKYKDRSKTLPAFLRGVKLPYAISSKTAITSEDKVALAGINMSAEKFVALMINYNEDEWRSLENLVSRIKQGRRSKSEKESLSQKSNDVITKKMDEAYYLKDLDLNLRTFNRYRNKYGNYLMKDKFIRTLGVTGAKRAGRNQDKVAPVPKQFVVNQGFGGKKINKKFMPKSGKNNTPKVDQDTFDSASAKANPKEFFKNNRELVQKVMNLKSNLNPYQAMKIIASGKYKNLEELKKSLKSNKKVDGNSQQ